MCGCRATRVTGVDFAKVRMDIRPLVIVFAVFALVAKLGAPCEASPTIRGANVSIAKCHELAKAAAPAPGESDQAPVDDADNGCSCALCQIGWMTAPPADEVFAIGGLEYHRAPRAPPAQTIVLSRPNRSAPTRGPPSFV